MNITLPMQNKTRLLTSKWPLLFFGCLLLLVLSGFSFRGNDIRIQVLKKREQTIRLSPNPSFNGTVKVISESKASLHFYVFDMEGTMMYSTALEPGASKTVEVLRKGVYTYDVFRRDEGVEQGKITVF